MTDNGSAYVSVAHTLVCRSLGIRHIARAPTAVNQRQGRALHPHDASRASLRRRLPQLPREGRGPHGWIERYNFRRRQGALGHRPPIARSCGSWPGATWLAPTTSPALFSAGLRTGRAALTLAGVDVGLLT